MSKVSVIIPARLETFLQKTISDVLQKAEGDVEVLVGLDGYWPKPHIEDHQKVTLYHVPEVIGMRKLINQLAAIARGEYIMKLDAHCALMEGWDKELIDSCDKDWVVIPRRYSLDPETWDKVGDTRDYHFMTWPTALVDEKGYGMHARVWNERRKQRKDIMIDDEMTTQGSCYFMHRDYWQDLDIENYGWFGQESNEICCRTWLSGGQVKINKNVWYAHLWRGNKFPRAWRRPHTEGSKSRLRTVELYFNETHNLPKKFEWLIDKFWPIPTWEDGWQTKRGTVMAEIKAAKEKNGTNPIPAQIPMQNTLDYILTKFKLEKTNGCVGIPNYTRNKMAELFAELGLNKGLEVGTRGGEFAEVLCKANPNLHLTCVDMWDEDEQYKAHDMYKNHSKNYDDAKKRLTAYNCTLVRSRSVEAAETIPNESLDFVYIDANHRFEYVVADIVAWLPKIRAGGIMSGHDYKKFYKQSRHMGIKQAVDGFCSTYCIYPYFAFQTRCVDKNMPNRCGSFMWVKTNHGELGQDGILRYTEFL